MLVTIVHKLQARTFIAHSNECSRQNISMDPKPKYYIKNIL